MSNKERANKWLEIVSEDLSVAEVLYKTGHWLYVGFMCHQVIEKTLKAYWCVCRDDDPPYIHDHSKIAQWRYEQALERTRQRRPELLKE